MYIRFITGKVHNETSRETGPFQAACQTRKPRAVRAYLSFSF